MWDITNSIGIIIGKFQGKKKNGFMRILGEYLRNVCNSLQWKPLCSFSVLLLYLQSSKLHDEI